MTEKEINVFESEFVPKHRILSEKEKMEFLEKYKVKLSQLPRISIDDPAIKRFNPKPGDIVEIIREVPEIGKTKYYRVVVPKKS